MTSGLFMKPFRKALTIGTFDTPHMGHAILVERCKSMADEVVVAVNTDRFVLRYKGSKPLYDELERVDLMEQLGIQVVLNDGPGYTTIKTIKPDALVIGNDWLSRDYLAQIAMTPADFQVWGITLVYVPSTEGISSSDMKERLAREQASAT